MKYNTERDQQNQYITERWGSHRDRAYKTDCLEESEKETSSLEKYRKEWEIDTDKQASDNEGARFIYYLLTGSNLLTIKKQR